MKKLLLGTTALVGASFMATAAVAAPEVRIGGFFDFQVGAVSQDREGFGPSPGGVSNSGNERGWGTLTDNEVIVRVSDTTNSGLKWSLKLELEANTDENTSSVADEAVLTLSGAWGQVFFGSEDGPADTMKTGGKRATSDAGTGGAGGAFRRWINWTTATSRVYSNAADMRDSGDATKVAYITPRFAGFQAGVSFTPDRSEDGRYRDPDTRASGTEQNFWEFGANYDQKFDNFRLNVAAVHNRAENENTLRNDTRTWGIGAMVGFGAMKVGAGYGNDNENRLSKTATNGETTSWDVGVGYNMGAWDFGLSHYRSEAGNINSTGGHSIAVTALSMTYQIGQGLRTYAEAIKFKVDSSANNSTSFDNQGYALITGIGVTF